MEKNYKNWIIGIALVILLLGPIIINGINSKKIQIKSFNDFNNDISKADLVLYYFGSTDKEDYDGYKELLGSIKKEYKIPVYTVNNKTLTQKEKSQLLDLSSEFNNENVYAFIVDQELRKVTSDKLELKDFKKLVDLYKDNIISDEDIAYKTVSTYKEYMAIINGKNTVMTVFGRNTCGWCNKFKPVYNEVADEYNLDIYYIDSDSFNSTEYNKIMNSGLTIPALCSSTKKEVPLSNGFGTPLTIFTKNGKSINCIGGYTNKTNLIQKLKEVNIIK